MRQWIALALVTIMGVVVLGFTASVYAAEDPFFGPTKIDCAGAQDSSAVCVSKTAEDPISGNDGILIKIANVIAIMGGVAAIILIIVAGIKFMTAGGDSEKIKSARSTVINALVGVVIILLSRAIIIYVTTKL